MVEDINFPERLPAVSATGRVNKIKRKEREDEKPPFEKFLDTEDQKEKKKKKKKRKKESDKVVIARKDEKHQAQNSSDSSSSTGPAKAEDDLDKKIIDVRV